MLWIRRLFDNPDWADIRASFDEQLAMLGHPRDMMLLAAPLGDGRHHLFIGVPEASLLAAYYGFDPVLRTGLPPAHILLAGHQDLFQAMFQSG
jgi:hypothetical protein